MLVRIIATSGPGTVYQPGSLVRVSDKKAQYLVSKGLAELVDAELVDVGIPRLNHGGFARTHRQSVAPPPQRPSTHMLPPRHIAPDGRVFKNQKELDEHKREC